ncbi:MAG: hypothetical protein J5I93_30875 [Pirellulaceae bacterium]|nr:hypothetical protein [Pirellulaceae bacterium]
MSEWDWLAEVFVPQSKRSRQGATATGYAVADDLLLTVAHVLGDRTGTPQVRWCHPDHRQWKDIVEIAWDGRGVELDAVLLRCACPPETKGRFPLGTQMPEQGATWESLGFAAAGKRGDFRQPVKLDGRVIVPHRDDTELTLGVDYTVAKGAALQGASGCPVVINQRLAGLVVSYPAAFAARRVTGLPLRVLLHDPVFRKVLNFDQQRLNKLLEQHRSTVRRQVTELLRSRNSPPDCQSVRSVIVASLQMKLDSANEESADEIAGVLVEQTDPEWAGKCLSQAAHSLRDQQKRREAEQVRKVYERLIPLVYPYAIVSELGKLHDCLLGLATSLVEVPAGLPIGAEAAFAFLEQRALEVVQHAHGFRGRTQLGVLEAGEQGAFGLEPGRGQSVEEAAWQLMRALASHPEVAPLDDVLRRIDRPGRGLSEKLEKFGGHLSRELSNARHIKKRRLYLAVCLPDDPGLADHAGQVLDLLMQRVQELVIVRLSDDDRHLNRDQLVQSCLWNQWDLPRGAS